MTTRPRLPPRDSITSDDMPLTELLRPLSARALPRRALVKINGATISEAEARANVGRDHHRPNTRTRTT